MTTHKDGSVPSDNRHVLASYLNSHGKRRWIVGQYVREFEIEAGEYADDSVYNDADDKEYIPEGWYECIDNRDDYSSVAVVNGVVDRWQELPKDEEVRTDGAPPDDLAVISLHRYPKGAKP